MSKRYLHDIPGDLDIFSAACTDVIDGERQDWREIFIHGNPEGLRGLAALLLELADTDQRTMPAPDGAREHYQLTPGRQLAASSDTVIIGRLDAKGTGAYFERFRPKHRGR